ncbi:MAG: DegV family protein [Xylanivirga thermophila]|jgi:DegV family protein with EDD domain
MMKNYIIMTDSCSDLPRTYVEEKNIPYVSLICRFAGQEYMDDFGETLSHEVFYEGMRKGEMPSTSQPNVQAFYEIFKGIGEQGNDIIYISVSSALSGTNNTAHIARQMVLDEYLDARITIIDSLTGSMGQGLMVMKAIEMKENGHSFEDTVDYLENSKLNLNTYITVEDLSHLKRGGRISSTVAMVGTVFNIKPILTVNTEGKIVPVLKAKGRKNAINKIVDYVHKKIEFPEEQIIAISHGDALEEAERLRGLILKEITVKDVIINHMGPVIGSYGGTGALVVFFMGKPRQGHIIDVDLIRP